MSCFPHRILGPCALTLHYLIMAGVTFGYGVRGLPGWYQALIAVLLGASLALLWMTHLVDPGIIPPSREKDPLIAALERGDTEAVPYSERYTKALNGTWVRAMTARELAQEQHRIRQQQPQQPLQPPPQQQQHMMQDQQQQEFVQAQLHDVRRRVQEPQELAEIACQQSAPAAAAAAALPLSHALASSSMVVHKYCITCNIWRPERAHHCRVCGFCMDHFDHHCGTMGTCIARLNHRFFAGFMVLAQVSSGLALGGCVWRLRREGFPRSSSWSRVETYLLLLIGLLMLYHIVMLGFGTGHCLLLALDITTKDCINSDLGFLRRNPPCLPGARSPIGLLLRAYPVLLCGPVRLRPNAFKGCCPGRRGRAGSAAAAAAASPPSLFSDGNAAGINAATGALRPVAGNDGGGGGTTAGTTGAPGGGPTAATVTIDSPSQGRSGDASGVLAAATAVAEGAAGLGANGLPASHGFGEVVAVHTIAGRQLRQQLAVVPYSGAGNLGKGVLRSGGNLEDRDGSSSTSSTIPLMGHNLYGTADGP